MNEKALRLRTDIEVIPATYQGHNGIIVRDPLGLLEEPVFLHGDILDFLSLIDGKRTKRDIQLELMRNENGLLVSMEGPATPADEEVERLIKELDDVFLLESEHLQQARENLIKEYSLLKVRKSVLAGSSFPETKDELKGFIDSFLTGEETAAPVVSDGNICALIAPHIEITEGKKVYAAAYRAIAQTTPKKIILMGTGHTLQQDFISICDKDFETPFGIVKTDKDFAGELKKIGKDVVAGHDMAHRSEHSLEIQLVFLQHLFGNDFTIVPLLFGAFDREFGQVSRPAEIPGMTDFLAALKQYISEDPGDTLVVAGVDLSHIGPKFAHRDSAHVMLPETRKHDRQVIDAICRGDVNELWGIIAGVRDRFNVCGFSTLACLLEVLPPSRGIELGYDIYDEEQTKSAVSFAAVTMLQESGEKPRADDGEQSTTYKKDPRTGKWIIQNPAGSMGYNYLYRDPDDW